MNKTIEELIEENEILKNRIKMLEMMIYSSGNESQRTIKNTRIMIAEKVAKEVKKDDYVRVRARRQLMQDLKWDLRIRENEDFRPEHLEAIKKYIAEYKFPAAYEM